VLNKTTLQRSVPEDGTRWATFETECGSKIVFWGSPDRGNINVNLLKRQVLPVGIDIEEDLDHCLASSRGSAVILEKFAKYEIAYCF
jgi:hypothetical protein